MSNFKTGYYSADNVKGVQYFGDAIEDGSIDVLSVRDFKESLDSIYDENDLTQAESINKEYKKVSARVANKSKKEGATLIASVWIKGLKYRCYMCQKRGKIKTVVL